MKEIKTESNKKWKWASVILVLVLMSSFLFFGQNSNQEEETNLPTVNENIQIIESNDPILGAKDARISIVEFSDFQCPFCARAHFGALDDFRNSEYFLSGEINLIYKQFPLNSIHPFAQKAAEASLCAQDQGKFWEYHDLLFENQADLRSDNLKSYAAQLGLNAGDFNSCLDNGDYAAEVRKETSQAEALGGRGTPYFIIINNEDGRIAVISGAYPWGDFEYSIDSIR